MDRAVIIAQPISAWPEMLNFLSKKFGKPTIQQPILFWANPDYCLRWDVSEGKWIVFTSDPKITTEFLLRW